MASSGTLSHASANDRPALSFWQIWNMCFGFLGIQFGFALQNSNVSRIFETLGAAKDDIPMLWIAAPLTGLLVQPIVGYLSDRTWHPLLGRRRPYFLIGAVLSSLALIAMPNSPALWIAAGLLWVLDASINITMEPFRAFVADQLPPRQRATGYSMQSFFIGIGAVVASLLPWLLTLAGVPNTAPEGVVPDNVRYAFYAGAVVLFTAVMWTIVGSREYPPDVHAPATSAAAPSSPSIDGARARAQGRLLLALGVAATAAITGFGLERDLYVLSVGIAVYGALLWWLGTGSAFGMAGEIMHDLYTMPNRMRQLAVVQFFSWFALFAMWIYTNSTVTAVHFGATDATSRAYNDGADWVGVLFAAYNGFAAIAAILIPFMVKRYGARLSHLINLSLGGLGLISFYLIDDPQWLLLSMVGVGFAWASILSLPYALLADCLPAGKMGVYMGIFNFFIVIPQLVAASILGFVLTTFFDGQPIFALVMGGFSMLVAGVLALNVKLD
ncbi:MFS transporter [Silanimonas sp.]|jgi:maltose/moltooligosaccharide transporter|uniref:MFS transporter n=1 Tax=Silanimonas sp. TaxID=1929290 RepID=UPI0022BB2613|nr:MFS transporter [Silanimonas sp.]MCZ8165679.1 MFS transporter [Silanimonas sp.]